ncbi:MAG TPA: PAS domain S-box protein [Nodosilinea sp.]|nr:PAS domain S-box protein [Nodosilinea sp.]
MKVLVVEDDAIVAQAIAALLVSHHYAVDIATDGLEGLEMAEAYSYDLLLLDIGLPGMDGVSLCQQLRTRGMQTPILLLTGQDIEAHAKAAALNAGADDYVTKPFDSEELLARLQTLLRRGDLKALPVLQWGALSLDPSRLQVSYGNSLLNLTPKEYTLLEVLLRHAPNILSTSALLEQGWNALENPSDEAIRTHVKEVRKKLKAAGAPEDFIKTAHRQGYRLNPLYGEATFVGEGEAAETLQMAELRAVNEELRTTLEQLHATQAELQQRNWALQAMKDELEARVAARTAELRQREAFLSSIYEGAEQSIFVVAVTEARDFRYVSLNCSAQESTGISLEEFQNKTPEAVFGPEVGAQFRQNYERCVQANRSITYEDHFVFQGRPVWALTTLSPLRDATGRIDRLVGTVLDISEQQAALRESKCAEAALHLSETKYRALFNEIDEGYCIAEILLNDSGEPVDYRILEANPRFEQLTALSLEVALSGRTIREIAPELEEHWYQRYGHVALTGEPLRFEQQAAGWNRWYDVYAFRIGEPERRQIAILFNDISDRKRAEAALRDSEELLRLALTGAQAGSWDWVVATGQLSWSPETYRLYGLDPAEGLPDYEGWYESCLHPDDRDRVKTYMAQVLAQKLPKLELEFRIVHPEAGVRWLQSLGRLTCNDQGEPLRLSGINLDISDRKQAELVLQQQIRQEYLLADIAQEIRQSLDLNQVLHSTVDRVREWLTCDRVIVFRFRPDWQGDVIMESVGDGWTAIASTTIVDPCLQERFIEPYHQGHISVSNDIHQSGLEPCYVEFLEQFQVQANLAVPILQGHGLWGLLIAHHCAAPRQWQAAEITILKRLSTQVGIAIQQAELYEQIHRELSQRAQIQTVLQESEERFRTLSAAAPVGILQTNADGICLYANGAWQQMSGLSLENSLGNGWLQAVHPDDRASVAQTWDNYLADQRAGQSEFRLLTPTQDIRWISARVAAIKSTTDAIVGYVITYEDITERKQAEQALRVSEQRLQAILDYSPAVIYLLDPQNRHLLVNHSYAEQLKTTPDNLVGKTLHDIWPAEFADQFATQNRAILETGQLLQIEDTVPLADGIHSYITVKFPLCDATGTPYAICGISTDITEKKYLEAQFYQAQRLESLGTLAGGIAHDLNNVLTPILTLAQVLQLTQKGLNTKGLEQLKLLETSAKRGANLVKQILTVTRTSQGEQTAVDLAALLREEIEIMRQSFPKAIAIQVDLPESKASEPALGMILADPTYLHQIILNLCINARDAMADGGTLTIAATTVAVDEAMAAKDLDAQVGHYAVITVADTGTGVSPEVQERMFDPFFTTKAPGEGTGLGLATVRGLVKANQGFLQVFSEVGKGTQFKIYLPLMEGQVTVQAPTETTPRMAPGNRKALILVVEDEEVVRRMLRSLLESHPYRLLLAPNGAAALDLYRQHQGDIQLVVTDIMMPVLDGLTFIASLRALSTEISIIALSGIPSHEDSALASGANYFLNKPFDANAFLNLVAIALQHIRSTPLPPAPNPPRKRRGQHPPKPL